MEVYARIGVPYRHSQSPTKGIDQHQSLFCMCLDACTGALAHVLNVKQWLLGCPVAPVAKQMYFSEQNHSQHAEQVWCGVSRNQEHALRVDHHPSSPTFLWSASSSDPPLWGWLPPGFSLAARIRAARGSRSSCTVRVRAHKVLQRATNRQGYTCPNF